MIAEGDFILFRFPRTDLRTAKLRPALLIKKVPNRYDDWLVCMVSTQTHQQIDGIEWVFRESDAGFGDSGLKKESLIRISRLAVVDASIFEGKLGSIPSERLSFTKKLLAGWISE